MSDSSTCSCSNGSSDQLHVMIVVELDSLVKVSEVFPHFLAGVHLHQLDHMTDGKGRGAFIGDQVSNVHVEPAIEFHQVWQQIPSHFEEWPLHSEPSQESELAPL